MLSLSRPARGFPTARIEQGANRLPVEVSLVAQLGHGAGDDLFRQTSKRQRGQGKPADLLYGEIDRNKMFVGTAVKEDRSRMNICFVMAPGYEALEGDFLKFAQSKGMDGIKGHRSVGGFRASCYNAMPKESVQALVDCMQEFEKQHADK